MRCMPRTLPIVCSCLLYGFIARVAADIPQNHTTLLAVDPRIVYHPLLDLETDCAHVPCSGWWTHPGHKSGPLASFSFLRSTASSTAQFSINFSGTSYIAIYGQKISGAQAIVTLDPGPQHVLTASATEGNIFELDNLHSDLMYNLQFTYEGPQTISIAALYFDRAVTINPLSLAVVEEPDTAQSTTPTKTRSAPDSTMSQSQKTSTLSVTPEIPNGRFDTPDVESLSAEFLIGDGSDTARPPGSTLNPSSRSGGFAPSSSESHRTAVLAGCLGGALGLTLLSIGIWCLRLRFVARRNSLRGRSRTMPYMVGLSPGPAMYLGFNRLGRPGPQPGQNKDSQRNMGHITRRISNEPSLILSEQPPSYRSATGDSVAGDDNHHYD